MTCTVMPDAPAGVLHLRIDEQKLTADDYRELVEPALLGAAADGDGIRLVVELEGDVPGVELSAMLEDARTGARHWSEWRRIAVVCEQRALQRVANLMSGPMPGQMRGFAPEQLDDAMTWAAAG